MVNIIIEAGHFLWCVTVVWEMYHLMSFVSLLLSEDFKAHLVPIGCIWCIS